MNTATRNNHAAADFFIAVGMCLAVGAVVTLGDQAFYWMREGVWSSVIIGDVWFVSGLRALPVDSDNARAFIDWLLDLPLSDGLFALAAVMVCIGGLLFMRRHS